LPSVREEEAALTAYSYEKKFKSPVSPIFLDFLILSLALPCHLSGELKGNGR